MNNYEEFKRYDLTNTKITKFEFYEKEDFYGIHVSGNLKENEDNYHFYKFSFGGITQDNSNFDMKEVGIEGTLKSIYVKEIDSGKYRIEMKMYDDTSEKEIDMNFYSENCYIYFNHYLGIDYSNIYESKKYKDMEIDYQKYCNEKYFEQEYKVDIIKDLYIQVKEYIYKDEKRVDGITQNSIIYKGKVIYTYQYTSSHQRFFKKIIEHSNGHTYFAFKIFLYGISFIDLESYKVYHYIPKGYDSTYDYVCGESFIITDYYYDKDSDLIAYEGCYWAGPFDVKVGELQNPFDFNPYLYSTREIIDPNYDNEDIEDIDFKEWSKDKVLVQSDTKEVFELNKNLFHVKHCNVE